MHSNTFRRQRCAPLICHYAHTLIVRSTHQSCPRVRDAWRACIAHQRHREPARAIQHMLRIAPRSVFGVHDQQAGVNWLAVLPSARSPLRRARCGELVRRYPLCFHIDRSQKLPRYTRVFAGNAVKYENEVAWHGGYDSTIAMTGT